MPVRVRYETVEIGPYDIHVRVLRDRLQFDDVAGEAESFGVAPSLWPLFGLMWASGRVLAERALVLPIDGLRVLEVGCGIGLATLVLNRRGAQVTATDQHPEAGVYLAHNVALNGGPVVPFLRASWREPCPALGVFDVLLGSDLLYEADAADALAGFLDAHAAPAAQIVVVDPGRGQLNQLARRLHARGFTGQQLEPTPIDGARGQVLTARRLAPAA